MDFEKAKTISIIAFIILNIALLSIRFYSPSLSAERIEAINYVLNRKGIYISEDFEFIRVNYKRQLELSHRNLDVHTIRPIFFINNQNVYNDQNIFYNSNERITFLGENLIYENFGEYFPLNKETAREFAENILNSLGITMTLDFEKVIENGFKISYRGKYNNVILYHNQLIITVIEGNLSKINFSFIEPISFFGPNRAIKPLDEALLAFARNNAADKLKSVNIVYDLLSYEVSSPFFRIIYTYNNFERSALISAY